MTGQLSLVVKKLLERVRERELESEKKREERERENGYSMGRDGSETSQKRRTRWAYARVGLKLVPSRDGFKTLVTTNLEPIARSAHRIGWRRSSLGPLRLCLITYHLTFTSLLSLLFCVCYFFSSFFSLDIVLFNFVFYSYLMLTCFMASPILFPHLALRLHSETSR